MVKYILVTGGVISGIGKGIVASSTGLLLKSYGFKVTAIKIDPYLNIDAGTISPIDHGEVFVLDDGGEVDLDLGNYERFLDVTLQKDHNITTGKIYLEVIEKERRGDFLGKTVQVIPHITNAIQDWVERVSRRPVDDSDEEPDFCVVELGGTVGDIENAPFIEALRQFQFRVGHQNICVIYVSLIPVVGSVGEQKSKPTQAGVRELRSLGLTPDIIACRCAHPVEANIREKISMFCHVTPDRVLSVHDCSSVYHVPLLLHQQDILRILMTHFNVVAPVLKPHPPSSPLPLTENGHQEDDNYAPILNSSPSLSGIILSSSTSPAAAAAAENTALPPLLQRWALFCDRLDHSPKQVRIALVGKYTELQDSYISITKALNHASVACDHRLLLDWIEATDLETPCDASSTTTRFNGAWQKLRGAQGILVPGGFGVRGLDGKILAVQYAREQGVPFLGICLGLQVAVIEFARHVLHWKEANSTEMDEHTPYPVVISMPEISKTHMGGTMRLGQRMSIFRKKGDIREASIVQQLYGNVDRIYERHRHRYEVNPKWMADFEAKGLIFVAQDELQQRMSALELERKQHRFFVATQYHPEFLTRPMKPTPIFLGFVLAAANLLDDYLAGHFVPSFGGKVPL